MKATYILTCRNNYGEKVVVNFKSCNILDARIMAENWLKNHLIKQGWVISKSGKKIFVHV